MFLYIILAIKHRVEKNPQRVKQHEKYLDELIYDETEFPMKIPCITFVEQKNFIGINVYECEEYDPDNNKSVDVELFNRCYEKYEKEADDGDLDFLQMISKGVKKE